ncbi:NADH-quinone oxidoreductase subunit N [Rhizomicrobium palustre]|uniref:NADH-quinone oxidoreductase subunit N n=1 Tax=Rhizomicrobium palustre TaxID=189966 RepID=A0A846N0S0_9PROT|nr:NADH-quinone oxidoreductase subunit NuoN [Rhizomicrobium palustre]NIK89554.1 NADH-quinone oxidoreductase subunit N [Rhizomicrobium palustre]
MTISHDLLVVAPELILAVGSMVALMIGAATGEGSAKLVSILMALLMFLIGCVVVTAEPATAFGGAFTVDAFSRFAKLLILGTAALCTIMASNFFSLDKQNRFELPVLIGLSTLGMMVMVSAGSFLSLYLGLELQSLALYVLAAFNRDSVRSTEAGLKYFVLGALSSGMMLYGISLIYGFTGSIEFSAVAGIIVGSGVSIGLIFGLVFLIAGLCFKISAVPFHMWAPDVYEGAPTPITAFFTTAAKVAALALMIRAILVPFPGAFHQWQQIIVVVSVLSMWLGAVAAIGQNNIKRLMAYSSIGHMGYALLGLAAGTQEGAKGMLVYIAYYAITNIGTFVCIQAMRRDGKPVESISDLAGLARSRPAFAFALSALMWSLAGLPPLGGIVAKIYVFGAAVHAGLFWPAVLGVLASCVAAYYYLRIAKVIYFDEPAKGFDKGFGGPGMGLILAGSTVFTVALIAVPWVLVSPAGVAASAILH